jgi:hypothetical protein
VSATHVDLHDVASAHAKLPGHAAAAPQLPAPSHVEIAEFVHPPAHVVAEPKNEQSKAFEPSQNPPHVVPELRHVGCPVRGAPLTGVHVPSFPGSAHA